jgi:hypothetical protein
MSQKQYDLKSIFGLLKISLVAGVYIPGYCFEAHFDISRKTNAGVL